MLEGIKHYTSVAMCSVRLSVQRQIEYPIFLITWIIAIPIAYLTGVLLLYYLVDAYQALNGWTFPQLIFLYGLGDISHGIMITLAIQTWSIDDYVIRGEFDRMIVRPMNIFFQFLVTNVNFVGLLDILTGGIIFAYACHEVNMAWSLPLLLKIVSVIIGAALIRSSFYTILCSVAFWTKRSYSLVWLGHDLLERTTLYPVSIYPYAVQMLLTFIVPLAFISFYPASEFIGQDARFSLPLGLSVWTPIVGILMFALSNIVFKTGLRNYESAGS